MRRQTAVTYQLFPCRLNLITDLSYQLIVVVAMLPLPGLGRLRCLPQTAFNHHTRNSMYPGVYTFYFRSSQRLKCSRSRVGFVHSNYYDGLMCKLTLYYLMYFIFQ